MVELPEEPLFAVLRHFGYRGYRSSVLPAQKVPFVPPMAFDLIDQRIVDLREGYPVLLNIFTKQLVYIYIAHF